MPYLHPEYRDLPATRNLFAAYIGDGYLYGASESQAAKFDSFWSLHLEEDTPFVVVPLDHVPAELAARLEDQGTGRQFYSDGYEAARAARPYVRTGYTTDAFSRD